MEKTRISTGPSARPGTERPKRLTTESMLVEPAAAPDGGQDAGGQRQREPEAQRGQGERQRVGVARGDKVGHGVVQADGAAQVAVQDAVPVVEVLRPERQVEAVLVAQGADVGWRCALAEHLQNGVAGNQVNEQKDQRNHQPDDGKGEREAGEDLLHGLNSTINQRPRLRRDSGWEHFRKWCRPEFYWYPTHSAEKRGMDGARKSTSKAEILWELVENRTRSGKSTLRG